MAISILLPIPPMPDRSPLDRLLKVHASFGTLMTDSEDRPQEVRKSDRWVEVYRDNDELIKRDPPDWLKKAYRIVKFTLDQTSPVLIREPQDPGQCREMLRAFIRITRIIKDVRCGKLK